jgi:hypothetical protein
MSASDVERDLHSCGAGVGERLGAQCRSLVRIDRLFGDYASYFAETGLCTDWRRMGR